VGVRVWAISALALGLIIAETQCAATDYELPIGSMPDPKVIEAHCAVGAVSRDAVRNVIARAAYRFVFTGPGDDGISVHRMLDRWSGAVLHYRPGVPTLIPQLKADANGHPRLVRNPRTIRAIAIGDGPGRWNGRPMKDMYVHFDGVKGWFPLTSSDLEAVRTRQP